MKDSILLFLVLFPIIGAFISYLIGKRNKALRDYFAALVCIIDLVIMVRLLVGVVNGNNYDIWSNMCFHVVNDIVIFT